MGWYYLGSLDTDVEMIILKWSFQKLSWKMWTGFIWLIIKFSCGFFNTVVFNERWGDFLTSRVIVILSRRYSCSMQIIEIKKLYQSRYSKNLSVLFTWNIYLDVRNLHGSPSSVKLMSVSDHARAVTLIWSQMNDQRSRSLRDQSFHTTYTDDAKPPEVLRASYAVSARFACILV